MRKYKIKKAYRYKRKKPIVCKPVTCDSENNQLTISLTWREEIPPGYYNALLAWYDSMTYSNTEKQEITNVS